MVGGGRVHGSVTRTDPINSFWECYILILAIPDTWVLPVLQEIWSPRKYAPPGPNILKLSLGYLAPLGYLVPHIGIKKFFRVNLHISIQAYLT